MILVNVDAKIDEAIFHIEEAIWKGAKRGAYNAAVMLQREAKGILETGMEKTAHKKKGQHTTGVLEKSIFVRRPYIRKNFCRVDVKVDMNRAPYALWVEYGNRTAVGLPYESKYGGGAENPYRKSSFKGHRYMTKAISVMTKSSFVENGKEVVVKDGSPAHQSVSYGIAEEVLKLSRMKKFKRL